MSDNSKDEELREYREALFGNTASKWHTIPEDPSKYEAQRAATYFFKALFQPRKPRN